jgi:glucan-binding YG repeat protein
MMSAVMMFGALAPCEALASSSSAQKISTIYLDLDLTNPPEKGDSIESSLTSQISAAEDMYRVTSADYTNDDDDEWQNGDVPEIEVKVEILNTNEYVFKSGLSAKVSSSVTTKKITAKRNDEDEATIKIQLKKISGDLDEPDDVEWTNNHVASWDEVDGAKSYQVKLYRDDKSVTTVDTTNLYYDFAAQITKTGDYYFKVKAKASSSGNNSDWSDESDEITISSSDLTKISSITPNNGSSSSSSSTSSGRTYTTTNTYTSGAQTATRYNDVTSTNSYVSNYTGSTDYGPGYKNPTNPTATSAGTTSGTAGSTAAGDGWKSSASGWYYVYGGNIVYNTWLHDANDQWFFVDKNGYMVTGWYQDYDGNWYYLNPTSSGTLGAMVKGWVQVNGYWYYMNPNAGGPLGALMTGDITVDGTVYHLDSRTGVLK